MSFMSVFTDSARTTEGIRWYSRTPLSLSKAQRHTRRYSTPRVAVSNDVALCGRAIQPEGRASTVALCVARIPRYQDPSPVTLGLWAHEGGGIGPIDLLRCRSVRGSAGDEPEMESK